nr:EOG090X0ARF [Lepidurus arcticus]
MPKKRGGNGKKGKSEALGLSLDPVPSCKQRSACPDAYSDMDEESLAETGSITSTFSDHKSTKGDESAEVDERSQVEILEDKLKDAIDLTTQKSSQGRASSFEILCKAFSMKYLPEFVLGRRMTLLDCVERGLKKGRGAEQEAAAKLGVLLCLQLGAIGEAESVYRECKPILTQIALDPTAPLPARAQCCTALGLSCFLASNDVEEVSTALKTFETIFSAFTPGTASNASPELARLYTSAVAAWNLLLTLLGARQVYSVCDTHIAKFSRLLESPDVDLRIVSGEAIALLYEGGREFDETYGFEEEGEKESEVAELCNKLRQLATDSHKYRAKKDRKQQRSSFRDILRAVEENEVPEIKVKFGKEVLELDSWTRKHQYDAFCSLLGSGMNLHLTENEFLRDIFGLGSPLVVGEGVVSKIPKSTRNYMNMAAFKARSVARSKNRDKRVAMF